MALLHLLRFKCFPAIDVELREIAIPSLFMIFRISASAR